MKCVTSYFITSFISNANYFQLSIHLISLFMYTHSPIFYSGYKKSPIMDNDCAWRQLLIWHLGLYYNVISSLLQSFIMLVTSWHTIHTVFKLNNDFSFLYHHVMTSHYRSCMRNCCPIYAHIHVLLIIKTWEPKKALHFA